MEYAIKPSILRGTVQLSGAKNSALKMLVASVLTTEPVRLTNYPSTLADARLQVQMLESVGKSCSVEGDSIDIYQSESPPPKLYWADRSIRTSLLLLGALVARWGYGQVPLPGGCQIGERRYDLHEAVLRQLGASVWQSDDHLYASAEHGLVGAEIVLPVRSTGATENAVICGSLARGSTTIWNPHLRPELLNLVAMLRAMGAQIRVFGQQKIEVDGVDELGGTSAKVINDNMEAMTWLIAASITGGDVEIRDFPSGDLEVPLVYLRESGARFYLGSSGLVVRGGACYPIDIATGPYPGINSDMQPLLAVYAACAQGRSRIVDLRFPDRYQYVDELAKLGVRATLADGLLSIDGGQTLAGGVVRALDLRAGAALVLAGLVASGTTRILDAWQIERGYDRFVEKLARLGGKIDVVQ